MSSTFVILPDRRLIMAGVVLFVLGMGLWLLRSRRPAEQPAVAAGPRSRYQPRQPLDTSGIAMATTNIPRWTRSDSLEEIARRWNGFGYRHAARLDRGLKSATLDGETRAAMFLQKATLLNFEGAPVRAYDALKAARSFLDRHSDLAERRLFTVIYLQGVTALRIGETENCLECRGASACIIPFDPAARHRFPRGSRLAIQHFTEYLREFPDDLEVRWLLNLAHMTLGEYPEKVDRRYYVPLVRYEHSEFDIGRFRDIGYLVMPSLANEAGGAIMDDFDNDGRLDLVFSSIDPSQRLRFYRNRGDGHFEDQTSAGLSGQLGGLNCVQTDYNNDGYLDLTVFRGAWLESPIRPSLLRNNGNGTFTDVTRQAGLDEPINANAGAWSDYDNDGFLDLFICGEKQPSFLYHNQGDGTFREVALLAGLLDTPEHFCKGVAWIDYDADDYPDLFLSYLDGSSHLFRNTRHGHFEDVTRAAGIHGPFEGFSCWAFDYDNDGRSDLFATCYDRTVGDMVKGLMGQPHQLHTSKLYHNLGGGRFADVTRQAGLDMVFSTMGSNFADFDNDGFLDMYLATGEPDFAALVPNRMLKNVAGQRFAEITGSSGTGHLQKGHGVSCGDWDRDGNVDLLVDLGGTVPGDRFHNALFQNPGHGNQWLTVKLQGKRTNRAAIGARIKIVTAGKTPQTIYRTVSSGSSFGANPLIQTIGLGAAARVTTLEIYWPTSHTTQMFRDLAVNQALEITEGVDRTRQLDWSRLPVPKSTEQRMAAQPVAR